ncbi:MAG: PIN domain-containing protein [Thermoanaerobaculia bacterium]
MILADTSVWVDHFRNGNRRLMALLDGAEILGHSFVVGELALGNLRRRSEILGLLTDLPQAKRAEDGEVLHFAETAALPGSGLGWVDIHLLCSAALETCGLWTLDRRLAAAASRLGLA